MFNFYVPTLFWDSGLILLLVCAFMYTFLLSRKLSIFYRNRQELERLLGAFSQSLTCAEASLAQLREKTVQFEESLNGKIRTATSLVDDLRFFSDRGEALIKDLEKEVRKARNLKQELSYTEVEEDNFRKIATKQTETLASLLPSVKESTGFLHQASGLN